MADYKIVKYCRFCKTRFVVERVDSRKAYCDACYERFKEEE